MTMVGVLAAIYISRYDNGGPRCYISGYDNGGPRCYISGYDNAGPRCYFLVMRMGVLAAICQTSTFIWQMSKVMYRETWLYGRGYMEK